MSSREYELIILKPGVLKRDRFGNILDARSTVSFINAQDLNIIVDTGLKEERGIIIDELLKYELNPDDIDILISTHSHTDHTGNNDLFPKAQIIGHKKEFWGVISQHDCKMIVKDTEILPGLMVMETPGHTLGSISVIIDQCIVMGEELSSCALTGDALPILDNYLKWVPPGINYDPQVALDSMHKIVSNANIIIPGHDKPFRILDKKNRKAEYL